MPSTQNIFYTSVLPQSASTAEAEQGGGITSRVPPSESFDVAQQQEPLTSEVNHAGGTGVVANRKPPINTHGDTQKLITTSLANNGGGAAASPAPGRFDASVNRMIEITDAARQSYLEDLDAEREGGDIEHSGYPEPDGRWR